VAAAAPEAGHPDRCARPAESDGAQWAEFRVNATTYRSYDTRGFDRLGWMRAAGLAQAAKATCGKVGYAMPSVAAG
jgi:hypothetical protein